MIHEASAAHSKFIKMASTSLSLPAIGLNATTPFLAGLHVGRLANSSKS